MRVLGELRAQMMVGVVEAVGRRSQTGNCRYLRWEMSGAAVEAGHSRLVSDCRGAAVGEEGRRLLISRAEQEGVVIR